MHAKHGQPVSLLAASDGEPSLFMDETRCCRGDGDLKLKQTADYYEIASCPTEEIPGTKGQEMLIRDHFFLYFLPVCSVQLP